MNLLDRYIFRSVLYTCAGAVGIFAFVLALANFVRDLLAPIAAGQISIATAGVLGLLLVPFVIVYALPMGMLTGILLVLGRLSADSEITAMRSSGISLTRMARPVFVLAILGAASALYANLESMPWARTVYHERLSQALQTEPLRIIVEKTYIRTFKGLVIYVDSKEGQDLGDIWCWAYDAEGRLLNLARAEKGHVDYDKATNELVVTPQRLQVSAYDRKAPEDYSLPKIFAAGAGEPMRFSLDKLLPPPTKRQKLQWMRLPELQEYDGKLAARDASPEAARELVHEHMKVAMTIQEKFSTALAVLSLALIGVPLGIHVSRRETSASLGVATILALGFYVLSAMVGWVDEYPEYRPDLLIWVPNIVFSAIGLWLFKRVNRK